MAKLVGERTYPGKESLGALIELLNAGNLHQNLDSDTPTVISYAIEELKTYPPVMQKEESFSNLIEALSDLEAERIERDQIDSDAMWKGRISDVEPFEVRQNKAQIENATQILQDTGPIDFYYAVEEKTNKIASAYETIDGKVLPADEKEANAVNFMFHTWLETQDMERRGDAVYIKGTDQLVDTEKLRETVKDERNGFNKYLENAGINVSLHEQEYKVEAPKPQTEVEPEVERAEELSQEAHKGMGT